jgi:hypothetical protein
MIERYLLSVFIEDPGAEDFAATRERLRDHFPRGATRRMTPLGILVGSVLRSVEPGETDAIVYASEYAESLALEGFLESFPTPSPTLFQTSIHPSAVQQALVARQRSVREFLPITGGAGLGGQAALAAALTRAPRTVLCGGEERGTWLLECGAASPTTFAFAAVLSAEPAGAIGALAVEANPGADGSLDLPGLFALLRDRLPWNGPIGPGLTLNLSWR